MILDSLVRHFKIRKSIAFAINVVTNLNKDAVIQFGITQFGAYKYILFGLYFTFIV
jgi:hypothetical protein